MPSIEEYRNTFPELKGLDDVDVIRKVAKAYDVPIEAVTAHMGYEPKGGDFWRQFKNSGTQTEQLLAGAGAAAAATAESAFGPGGLATAAKNAALEKYKSIGEELQINSKASDSATTAYDMARNGDPGALVDFLQGAIGMGLGQIGQSVLTAGAGGLLGKAALKGTVERVAGGMVAKETAALMEAGEVSKDVAEKIAVSNVANRVGQNLAITGQVLQQEGGEIGVDVTQKATDEGRVLTGAEVFRALAATAAAAGPEALTDRAVLDALSGKLPWLKSLPEATTIGGKVGRAAVAGGVGAGIGGAQEVAQTYTEELGKGNPIDEKAHKSAIDAGVMGAIAGAMPGAVGGYIHGPDITREKDQSATQENAGESPNQVTVEQVNQLRDARLRQLDEEERGVEGGLYREADGSTTLRVGRMGRQLTPQEMGERLFLTRNPNPAIVAKRFGLILTPDSADTVASDIAGTEIPSVSSGQRPFDGVDEVAAVAGQVTAFEKTGQTATQQATNTSEIPAVEQSQPANEAVNHTNAQEIANRIKGGAMGATKSSLIESLSQRLAEKNIHSDVRGNTDLILSTLERIERSPSSLSVWIPIVRKGLLSHGYTEDESNQLISLFMSSPSEIPAVEQGQPANEAVNHANAQETTNETISPSSLSEAPQTPAVDVNSQAKRGPSAIQIDERINRETDNRTASFLENSLKDQELADFIKSEQENAAYQQNDIAKQRESQQEADRKAMEVIEMERRKAFDKKYGRAISAMGSPSTDITLPEVQEQTPTATDQTGKTAFEIALENARNKAKTTQQSPVEAPVEPSGQAIPTQDQSVQTATQQTAQEVQQAINPSEIPGVKSRQELEQDTGKKVTTVINLDGLKAIINAHGKEAATNTIKALLEPAKDLDLDLYRLEGNSFAILSANAIKAKRDIAALKSRADKAQVDLGDYVMDGIPFSHGTARSLPDAIAKSQQEQVKPNITQKPIPSAREVMDKANEEPDTGVLPKGLTDRRFLKESYRSAVQSLSNSLVPGGGIAHIKDEHDRIIGRTSSVNPAWFQDFKEVFPSVKAVDKAVKKALEGKTLGKSEARIITGLMNAYDSEIANNIQEYGNPNDYRVMYEEERDAMGDIGSTPGEFLIAKLYNKALDSGIPENEIVSVIGSHRDDYAGAITALEGMIDEAKSETENQYQENTNAYARQDQGSGQEAAGVREQEAFALTNEKDGATPQKAKPDKSEVEAENRRKADSEAKDFRLSGSNRPADIAIAGGQQDLIGKDTETVKKTDQKENSDSTGSQDLSFYYTDGKMGMTSNGTFTSDKSRWVAFSRSEAMSFESRNIKPAYATRNGVFTGVNSGSRLKATSNERKPNHVQGQKGGVYTSKNTDQESIPDKIVVDGVSRPTRNSNGQLIAKDNEKIKAFWRWFGDSKIVDKQGRPLDVYHGTTKSFESFSDAHRGVTTRATSSKAGFFFTSSDKTASSYSEYGATVSPVQELIDKADKAEKRGKWDEYDRLISEAENLESKLVGQGSLRGQNTIPAYLSIKNPLIFDANGENPDGIGGINSLIDRAKKEGRDGVIIKNFDDSAGLSNDISDHYIAFKNTQIKSSIGNKGTYDLSNPSIVASRSDQQRGATANSDKISSAISRTFGNKVLTKLGNRLVIPSTEAELRAEMKKRGSKFTDMMFSDEASKVSRFQTHNVKGFYDPSTDTSYMLPWNMKESEAPGVFLHEVGVHYGLEKMLGDKYSRVVGDTAKMVRMGSKSAMDAMRSVNAAEGLGFDPDSKDFRNQMADKILSDKRIAQEAIAYIAEKNANHPFVKRIVSAIKEFLYRIGLTGKLDEGMLTAIAIRAARRGDASGPIVDGVDAMRSSIAPNWYSQMSRVLGNKLPAKGSVEQMKRVIEAFQRKGDFKAEELEHSGILPWLDAQEGSVTRDDIIEQLALNAIYVREVTLEDKRKNAIAAMNSAYEKIKALPNYPSDLPPLQFARWAEENAPELYKEWDDTLDDANGRSAGSTKFAEHQLPGGTNYREVLLTLPIDSAGNDFRSSHFDQPNIVAHLRVNDRTDANGKRVLFVEEVQSDWAQSIRKQKNIIADVISRDFDGIIERMKKSGILTEVCD